MPTTPPALRQRSAAGFANPRGSRRLTLERGGAVHRPPRLLTLAVTLAIAVSLLAVGVALAPLPPSTAESSTGGRAVAFAFYDVLNQALRSGDFVALDAVVAPDLITHDALGISRGRTVLEQRLAALRVFAPKLRLTPGEPIVDGDRAAVSVVATTRGDGAAQGNAPAMGWAALDLLRIADGRVVERWAFDEPGAAAQLAAQAALPSPPPEPVQATVVRFTFDPGANAAGATGGGPLVIALEQGSLLVRRESAATAASTQAAGSTGDVSLRPADALVIPAGVHFSLRNVGGAQTVFAVAALTSALLRPGGVLEGQTATNPAGVSLGPQWPVGVRAEALAASAPSRPPTGPSTIAIYRVTLAPGIDFSADAASAVEMFAVASGRLSVAVSGAQPGYDRGLSLTTADAAGAGASIQAGILHDDATASFRNAGASPLVIWVVTVAPDGTAVFG